MRPVLPAHVALLDELEERLVDQRRGLQRVVLALAPQVAGGTTPQLGMHHR